MKTTRAMLVIGILMLVLAVIVAQGFRPDETATVSGPVISGSVSRAPEGAPGATSATPVSFANGQAGPATSGGVLVPLDTGTLKMDSTTPATHLTPVSPADATKLPVVNSVEGKVNQGAEAPVAAEQSPAPEGQKRPAASTGGQKTPERLVVTTNAPKKLAPGQKAIARTRLEVGPRAATFRLTGTANLKGKAFALKEPDRVVMDLDGPWAINLERTPDNTLIKSVRAGSQEQNTRLVFDMHRPPKSFKLVQVAPKTLELQIR